MATAANRWIPAAAIALGAAWLARPRGGRFDGSTVLVTGGSRGLGLLLAREFARRGAHNVLCARDVDELERARRSIERDFGAQVLARRCDVTRRDEVEELVQAAFLRFGAVDVLANVAGVIQIGPAETMSEDDYRAALDVILWGTIHATRAVVPRMRERGGGRILDVTSIGGVVPVPHLAPYATAKFAAVGFSGAMGVELERHGIRVTTAVPGLMRTGSFVHALAKGQREKEMQWFSLGASLPILSMNAERAARRMVDACAAGRRWITVGAPARVLRLSAALAPGATRAALGKVARVLPGPGRAGPGQRAEPGGRHRAGVARSFLTTLGDRAAGRYNEVRGDGRRPAAR